MDQSAYWSIALRLKCIFPLNVDSRQDRTCLMTAGMINLSLSTRSTRTRNIQIWLLKVCHRFRVVTQQASPVEHEVWTINNQLGCFQPQHRLSFSENLPHSLNLTQSNCCDPRSLNYRHKTDLCWLPLTHLAGMNKNLNFQTCVKSSLVLTALRLDRKALLSREKMQLTSWLSCCLPVWRSSQGDRLSLLKTLPSSGFWQWWCLC